MRIVFPHVDVGHIDRNLDSVAAELALPPRPLAYFRAARVAIQPTLTRKVLVGLPFPSLLDAYRAASGLPPQAPIERELHDAVKILTSRDIVLAYDLNGLLLADSLEEVEHAALGSPALSSRISSSPSDILFVPHPSIISRLGGRGYNIADLVGGRVERVDTYLSATGTSSRSLPEHRIH